MHSHTFFDSIAQSDFACFDKLYSQQAPALLTFAKTMLGHHNMQQAQQIVNQHFLHLWQHPLQYTQTPKHRLGLFYTLFRANLRSLATEQQAPFPNFIPNAYQSIDWSTVPQHLHAFYQAFNTLSEHAQIGIINAYYHHGTPDTLAERLKYQANKLQAHIDAGLQILADSYPPLAMYQHPQKAAIGRFVLWGWVENNEIEALCRTDNEAFMLSLAWEQAFHHFTAQLPSTEITPQQRTDLKQKAVGHDPVQVDPQELQEEQAINKSGKAWYWRSVQYLWIRRRFWRFLSVFLLIALVASWLVLPFERHNSHIGVLYQPNNNGAPKALFLLEQREQLIVHAQQVLPHNSPYQWVLWHSNPKGQVQAIGSIVHHKNYFTLSQPIHNEDTLSVSREASHQALPSKPSNKIATGRLFRIGQP